jgi:hypothetical protein
VINRSPQPSASSFRLRIGNKRLNAYFSVALILLTGCTATQTRWDATNIRKEVMVYYNDQIMDNLIRAKNHLPFVHVDITLLTSQGGSQITGTIGAGESRTNTNTSKSMAGVVGTLGTIANAVTRPFSWSVSPQQTETLSIQAAPALGGQAIAEMSPLLTKTKETEEIDATTNKPTKVTKEKTPTPVTIYKLYEDFAFLSGPLPKPETGTYVPGTLKRLGSDYYYIANNEEDKKGYYEFCKKLFIKGQSQTGSLERALQQTQAAAALPTR